jgi:hypothetical protein
MSDFTVPATRMLLPPSTLAQAKPLLGFDHGNDIYHVLAFDFGDDGGAIGIWREGSDFCARISLDGLAAFYAHAAAQPMEGSA